MSAEARPREAKSQCIQDAVDQHCKYCTRHEGYSTAQLSLLHVIFMDLSRQADAVNKANQLLKPPHLVVHIELSQSLERARI